MALQLVIAGRKPLPKGKPLHLELEYEASDDDDGDVDDGSLVLWEDEGDDPAFVAEVSKVVGFLPASLVLIRPAGWELSAVVAEELAHALEAVVFCFTYDGVVIDLDCKGRHRPVASRPALVERLTHAFDNPRPFFERWERAAQDAHDAEVAADPKRAAEDDWSDL